MVLAVADFGQVHPGDHAQPSRQPLQQQADDGGAQQHPEELTGREQRHRPLIRRLTSSNKGQITLCKPVKKTSRDEKLKLVNVQKRFVVKGKKNAVFVWKLFVFYLHICSKKFLNRSISELTFWLGETQYKKPEQWASMHSTRAQEQAHLNIIQLFLMFIILLMLFLKRQAKSSAVKKGPSWGKRKCFWEHFSTDSNQETVCDSESVLRCLQLLFSLRVQQH